MFSEIGRKFFAPAVAYIVGLLQKAGVSPNAITATGFVLTFVSAIFLAQGYFRWGAIILFIASVFDMLDGALARATSQSTVFGAFLDSTLDRYSESVAFLALVYYYSGITGSRVEIVLIFFIIVGSLMVSYTRARAEALNVTCKAGILQRPERVVLLIAGLLTGWLLPVLWLMAILTNVSAIQRIYEVYVNTKQLNTKPRQDTSPIAQSSEQPPI